MFWPDRCTESRRHNAALMRGEAVASNGVVGGKVGP